MNSEKGISFGCVCFIEFEIDDRYQIPDIPHSEHGTRKQDPT
jgi:hypothetical protein